MESRSELYEHAVINTTSKILKGYNATILAYGQTSSGKPIFLKFHEASESFFSDLVSHGRNIFVERLQVFFLNNVILRCQ